MEEKRSIAHKLSRLERVSPILLGIMAFLIPIISIPASFPIELNKGLLVGFVALITFGIWLIARLADGSIFFPRNNVFVALSIVVFVAIMATIFSETKSVSFAGFGFEVDTLLSTILIAILLFLSFLYFSTVRKVFNLYAVIFTSAIVLGLIQFINLFTTLSFLGLSRSTDTLVGRWNEFGVFLGFCLVASMVAISMLSLERLHKIGAYAVFTISLAGLMLINHTLLWWALIFTVGVFLLHQIFSLRRREFSEEKDVSEVGSRLTKPVYMAVGLVVISLAFIIFGNQGGLVDKITERVAVTPLEVRPSWIGTFLVAKESLKENPLLGVGPGRFSYAWQQYKPAPVNQSFFWGVDFSAGIGLLPTTLITSGILGFLSWTFLILVIAFAIIRGLFIRSSDKFAKHVLVISGLSSLFLWVITIIYIPGLGLVALAAVTTGAFLSLESRLLNREQIQFSVSRAPVAGFASALMSVVLIIAVLSGLYLFVNKVRAWSAFQKGSQLMQVGDFERAAGLFDRAGKIDRRDLYYRSFVDAGLGRLRNLLASENTNQNILQTQFIELYGGIHAHALDAVTVIDQSNYLNWTTLARIYETIVPLKISGSYETAKSAYGEAAKRAPKNPLIPLSVARLELSQGNSEKSIESIEKSLALKSNYTAALFLRAQIAIQNGNIKKAREDIELVLVSSPNDAGALFQLGFIEYRVGNYERSIVALERAITISPEYSNAKYFLGLAYYEIDRTTDATRQFEEVLKLNPGNDGVEKILTNLADGLSPLSGFSSSELPGDQIEPPIGE